jgi:hypothetical protein
VRLFGWRGLRWLTATVLVSSLFLVYHRWRQGDTFYIPGMGTFFRFPCSSYRHVLSGEPGVIQAFEIIDGAAFAAHANDKDAVVALVDVVFDRLLPATRCGSPFRHRVADAEMSFRRGLRPSISESQLSGVANEVLVAAGAPAWARTSVAQLHLLRELLRPELPRFIGTVASEYHLSDRMSPGEVAFITIELGNGMIHGPEEFRDGPDDWVERTRSLLSKPAPAHPSGYVIVRAARTGADVEAELAQNDSAASRSVHQFLDHLGFPP